MIQGVISRMAHCSFLIKGWSVTLVTALFALAAAGTNQKFILLAYFPAFAFWSLDAYFLRQERLFRKLFDRVRTLPEEEVEYSLDASTEEAEVPRKALVAFSSTLLTFHGTIAGTIVLVMLFLLGHESTPTENGWKNVHQL